MKIKNTWFWSFVIFLSAAFFRIFFLDLIEFKFDEAITLFELNRFYNSPYFMQTGPVQSTGVYNFPLFNYIMIVLSFPIRDAQFLSFIVALINTTSVSFFYIFTRRFYNNFIAILASLILVFSPWSILLSRKIWIPDLIFPFVLISFYSFHKLIFEKNKNSVFFLFFFLSLLFQLHAAGAFFAFATILILVVFKRLTDYKRILLGIIIGFIPGVPYFLRQFSSSPFCIDCVSFFNYQKLEKPFDFYNFIRPFQLINGFGFDAILGKDYKEFINNFSFINYIFLFELFIITFGIIFILKYKRNFIFLLLYLLLIPLFYFISKIPSYPQYFANLMPVLAVIFALSFNYLFTLSKNVLLKSVVFLLFFIFIFTNIIFEISFYKFLSFKQNINGDYGAIYIKTKEFVEKETNNYFLLPYYNELKSYAFMFAQSPYLYRQLGIYFLQKNEANGAIFEFQKAIKLNPKDTISRANLAQIYILTGKKEEAMNEIKILEAQDSTTTAKLKEMFK